MRQVGLLVLALALGAVACGSGDDYLVHNGNRDAAVDAAPCGLVTCESEHATCGPVGDGCGLVVQCGACTAPDFCGGDGSAFGCGGGSGSGACVPRTCAAASATCGTVADGCGGVTASCGACGSGEVCGAGAVANACAVPPCEGLCAQQASCASPTHTTLTGKVTAPGHDDVARWGAPDPIYGALVYIPNGGPAPRYGVLPFTAGVACGTCSSLVSGAPLVSATTGTDGTFTIEDAPCGTAIPLVVQLGRWRRQITIPAVACCANTALTAAQTHLPRTHVGEPGDLRSDIPLMAVSTGDVDAMHCVLRKSGIDDVEFTNPGGSGRVQLYRDNGAEIDSATPAAPVLYDSATALSAYDLALFECIGEPVAKTPAEQKHVIDFANAGGRVFTTHYGYVWLTDSTGDAATNTGPKPFSQTASWVVNQGSADTTTALVDESLQADPETQVRRIAFATWLKGVGASTVLGQLTVNVVRHDFDAVSSILATAAKTPAQRWLYASTPTFTAPLHYTFDTPIAYPPLARPTQQCGRVTYSDFHISDTTSAGSIFPAECTDGPLTPQEKALEFMLFDLASCSGPPASACTPKTCAEQGIGCGDAGDGCDDGVTLHCRDCTNGEVCGGGGPSLCGTGLCLPATCAGAGATCGPLGNGCGGVVDCGTCGDGEVCGVDGVANQCGSVLK